MLCAHLLPPLALVSLISIASDMLACALLPGWYRVCQEFEHTLRFEIFEPESFLYCEMYRKHPIPEKTLYYTFWVHVLTHRLQ